MKIAVACIGKDVSAHFGHSETYLFCEVKGKEIIDSRHVPCPEHKPGSLPNFLNENNIDVVLAGGMGQKAVDIFNSHQIDVLVGVEGDALEAVKKYLNNELVSAGTFCAGHDH